VNANHAFEYPVEAHQRLHGPLGYADYRSYRDWLRDEFLFRCVFCLRREQWGLRQGFFHVDHYEPQAINPVQACSYDNLLYVCAACNLKKGDLLVPSPCEIAFGSCLQVHSDGRIEALGPVGELLVDILRLDDDDSTRYRKLMLETLAVLHKHQPETFSDWMSYPENLPDLSHPEKRPPNGNSRPEGVPQSCFAMRQRGELPSCY
jgi:hypothetical protein